MAATKTWRYDCDGQAAAETTDHGVAMKLDDVNRWMTLAASAGVIAGLVLLAFELQQNREMMRARRNVL